MIGETLAVGLALLFPGTVVTAPVAGSAAAPMTKIIEIPDIGGKAGEYYQLVLERQLIIRIPARPSTLTNFTTGETSGGHQLPMPIVWRETKAPKCVPMRSLVGIQAVQRDSIDLITRENERLRAKLNRGCRALDFYSGFYLKKSKDGRLCADRDALHARSGAECEVEKFRLMVPIRQEG